jgi:hypothetical protein
VVQLGEAGVKVTVAVLERNVPDKGWTEMVSVPGVPLLVNVKEQGVTQVNGGRPASGPLVIVNVTRVGVGNSWPCVERKKVLALTVWVEPTGFVSSWGVTLVQNCPSTPTHASSGGCWAEPVTAVTNTIAAIRTVTASNFLIRFRPLKGAAPLGCGGDGS